MRAPLKAALVSLDREAIRAGRPDLVLDVQTAWWSLQRVCDEIDAATHSDVDDPRAAGRQMR